MSVMCVFSVSSYHELMMNHLSHNFTQSPLTHSSTTFKHKSPIPYKRSSKILLGDFPSTRQPHDTQLPNTSRSTPFKFFAFDRGLSHN